MFTGLRAGSPRGWRRLSREDGMGLPIRVASRSQRPLPAYLSHPARAAPPRGSPQAPPLGSSFLGAHLTLWSGHKTVPETRWESQLLRPLSGSLVPTSSPGQSGLAFPPPPPPFLPSQVQAAPSLGQQVTPLLWPQGADGRRSAWRWWNPASGAESRWPRNPWDPLGSGRGHCRLRTCSRRFLMSCLWGLLSRPVGTRALLCRGSAPGAMACRPRWQHFQGPLSPHWLDRPD